MCSFCEGNEIIQRTIEFTSQLDVEASLRHDQEDGRLMLRVALGSMGYTLPIHAKFCMFCGAEIKQENYLVE